MNFKVVFLSLILITPVFSDTGNATKPVDSSKFKDVKLKILKVIRSAKSGNAESQLKLGMILTKGTWLKEDKKKAIEWWHKAAEQGNVKAQLLLGTVYLDGERVKKDLEKADYWFNKAIESDVDFIKVVNKMKAIIAEKERKKSKWATKIKRN
mgnify:FL=1